MLTNMKWRRVTVVGCGLMGGSFALALRRYSLAERIAGWDVSTGALDEALRLDVIDEVDEAFGAGGVSDSDLIYLAMPVGEIIKFMGEHGSRVKDGAVITDAGSTKKEILNAARVHLSKEKIFVGGHPVAGSHLRGTAHARAELFTNAPYILVDDSRANEKSLAAVKQTLELIGARVVLMSGEEHDHTMALVSHLPQLLSSALAKTVSSRPDAQTLLEVAGTGFRDMTRLAESSWEMWRDICKTNAAPIASALDNLIHELIAVRDELAEFNSKESANLSFTGSLFKIKST
ncbi:MAG TPA: prephenate dehydrogenase/arogenate dehydrogenase family protein [Pyrinomonadaceae bacterium]|nr:prephenate dehydrogenase/arogenate dehydrogenase family protein [Pyrinomonadaceae bacterium]